MHMDEWYIYMIKHQCHFENEGYWNGKMMKFFVMRRFKKICNSGALRM